MQFKHLNGLFVEILPGFRIFSAVKSKMLTSVNIDLCCLAHRLTDRKPELSGFAAVGIIDNKGV